MTSTRSVRPPRLAEALIPVVLMIAFLGMSVVNAPSLPELPVISPVLRFLGSLPVVGSLLDSGLTPHIPLIFGTVIASLMGIRLGLSWKEIERGMVDGIVVALPACLILMVIGMLIGTWIASGIVPTMIHFGLKLISPSVFLFTTCAICALVSLATGSSWSTAGTVGIALIGVGHGLNIPLPLVAGAIISGSYFGDKMSPISDTTVLAPSVAGTDVFTHVRHMVYTTGPSLVIALALYALIGLRYGADTMDTAGIEAITRALDEKFTVHWCLLIPPVLVIVMVAFKIPALPALLAGSVIGAGTAMLVQGMSLAAVMEVAQTGFATETGVKAVDTLLNRGGMISMLPTVALIVCALSFGGVMERTGMLGVIAAAILRVAKSTGSLIAATVCTCLGMNIIAPDQYLSIVVPGRMYREAYHKAGLHPKNLSRALEDSGTLTSPLVPWNSCGAYMWATLGVFPFHYAPFAFLNLINPLISILLGYLGWTITKVPPPVPHPAPAATPAEVTAESRS
ncbi:MAG: Na+/H+ antiporter NhaC [Opitutaceae bacterium]|nr:Na+/H+ antiporter NhaC [Opitutaceae bacterium]